MRLPAQTRRTAAVVAIVAGGGVFGASLSGLARVDATLSAAEGTSTDPTIVRVADRSDQDRGHGFRHGGGRSPDAREF
jgi:hypothetical protein